MICFLCERVLNILYFNKYSQEILVEYSSKELINAYILTPTLYFLHNFKENSNSLYFNINDKTLKLNFAISPIFSCWILYSLK